MPLWMLTPLHEGRVALRIRHAHDRARRVVLDDAVPDPVREEWRCSGCSGWFARDAVTLLESGRAVAGVPEVSAYCVPCIAVSRVRGEL